jgi:hypothetical protein
MNRFTEARIPSHMVGDPRIDLARQHGEWLWIDLDGATLHPRGQDTTKVSLAAVEKSTLTPAVTL